MERRSAYYELLIKERFIDLTEEEILEKKNEFISLPNDDQRKVIYELRNYEDYKFQKYVDDIEKKIDIKLKLEKNMLKSENGGCT